jgi:hypothetical protein
MPEVRMNCIHCLPGGVARLCLIGRRSYGDHGAMLVWQPPATGAVDVKQEPMTLRLGPEEAETGPTP